MHFKTIPEMSHVYVFKILFMTTTINWIWLLIVPNLRFNSNDHYKNIV